MKPTSFATSFSPTVLPSSTRAALAREEPAALVHCSQELFPYLRAVTDPRGRQGRRYDLAGLLAVCLVGFCTGCQGYLSVARWARALPPELLHAFGLTQGRTPCAATWLNLFRVLDWERVAEQFHAWAEAACRPQDGKVARGVAALRRGALNLLRRLGRRSIPEAADRVKADPTLLCPLIGGAQEN